ncbi:MAG: S8 family serine peptidase [Anaerolineae bacterium]
MRGQRRRLIRTLLVSGGILLVLGILVGVALLTNAFSWSSERTRRELLADGPGIELTPPIAIDDLAEAYPQLASVLSDPELATVYKEFVVAYQEGGVEAASELAKSRGLLTPDGQHLRVTLVLDTDAPQPLVDQLEGVGVEVVSAFRDRVNIAVPVALIEQAMQSEDVDSVFQQLTELQHVIAVRLPGQRQSDQQTEQGEGVRAVGAEVWHQAGFTGAGLRVGILDLGFAGYRRLLGRELPDNVEVETFGWIDDKEVHGTACAEIVHELAPDATLYLAWYDGSDAAMGEAVAWLRGHEVDIISHSAGSVLSPRDGTGWDAELVDETAATGVLWVNSAGNEADVHHRATFIDQDGDGYHDFELDTSLLPIYNEGDLRVFLVWHEDWERPTEDLELFVFDADGNVLASSEDLQDGGLGQQPAEWVVMQSSASVVYAAVYAYDVDRAMGFDLFAIGPGVEIKDPVPAYSVNSPGDAVGALTVGAVDWEDDRLARYSSQGPTTDERLKPEISGPTRISGITYGAHGFDGTSASAPHVAGVAALVWQAYPSYTRQELTDLLLTSAKDLGPAGPDTGYGFGRLQLPPPPNAAAVIASPEAPADEATETPTTDVTPTPVAFALPAPENDTDDRRQRPLVLVGLLVGGLSIGGTGLLAIGGYLLLSELRTRSTPSSEPPRPAPPLAVAPARPMRPSERPAEGPSLPSTERWETDQGDLRTPDAHSAKRPTSKSESETHCPSCGAPLRSGARFCPGCGTRLAIASNPAFCRHCGAALREDSRFCPKCGLPVDRR